MTGIVNCECSDGDGNGIAFNEWCYTFGFACTTV